MIGMTTEDSFSQGILARYMNFSDNISTEAEMLYLRNQGQPAEEPVEEVYETNIRNITNINQYITENPVLPLQIDLKFVGKLISGAVEKIAGTYTSTGAMTGHPAVLKTEGKTVAVDERETKRLSGKLRSGEGAEHPLTAAQAVANTRERALEPPVPYAAGAFFRSELTFEKNAPVGEEQGAAAAEIEQLEAERFHAEQERLVLKEAETARAASDLKERETGLFEERREFEHEREAFRQHSAEEPISRGTPVAPQAFAESAELQNIENRQEVLTKEFHDYIEQTGRGEAEPSRRPEKKAPTASAAGFVYPETAQQTPNRDFPGERAKAGPREEAATIVTDRSGAVRKETVSAAGQRDSLTGGTAKNESVSEEDGFHREPRLSVSAQDLILQVPGAEKPVVRDFTERESALQGPTEQEPAADEPAARDSALQEPTTRMPAAPAEPVSFIYPEAAHEADQDSTDQKAEPLNGADLHRQSPVLQAPAGQISDAQESAVREFSEQESAAESFDRSRRSDVSENEAPTEFRTFRQPASAAEPADLILSEGQTPESESEERSGPLKIRFPEKTAQEEKKRPEPHESFLRGEPEPILKARRLEQQNEPAEPVIVARRAGEKFAPTDFVYGQRTPEKPKDRLQSSGRNPLPEKNLPEKSASERRSARRQGADAGERPFPSAERTRPTEENPEAPRSPQALHQRPAPFEPVQMNFGAPNGEDEARSGEEKTAFSTRKALESGHKNENFISPETEESIKTEPSAVRRMNTPAPAETVLPASKEESSAEGTANPARRPSVPPNSERTSVATVPTHVPADGLSQKIAAKFRPATMEQRFRPILTERQSADPAFAGRIREAQKGNASAERAVPAGNIEDRMAAAGIETRTRPKKRIVSRTEELHEHTVNRAINMSASPDKPQQVFHAAVEEELMSSTSIRKIADKVYQELESRLRSEKIRRGNL
ncbi:MAG TPA: hypothetical protein PKY19_02130 [Oscillospiraceae bacterium]|nr:hypothetical protein [Oscillospiraceae bacterium]